MNTQNRELPHNDDAEQTLLGGLLMHSDAAFDEVAALLEPSDFYQTIHSEIFHTMLVRFQRGESTTVMSIKPHLAYMDEGDEYSTIGGTKYLAQLCGQAAGFSSIRDYAKAVKDASVRRGLVLLGSEMEDMAYNAPVDMTPSEIVEELEEQITKLGTSSDRSDPVSAVSLGMQVSAQARAVSEGRAPMRGIETGLQAFDAANGPLMPSDMIVLGGATSMGKTALAQQVLWNASLKYRGDDEGNRIEGARCLAFTQEMSGEQYITRHLSQVANIDSEKIELGTLTPDEATALDSAALKMEGMPLWIEDGRGMKANRIRSICRRHRRKHGLDMVLIDHLGFIAAPYPSMNPIETKEFNVSAIKSLAKELDCPIILISHLNRGLWARDDKRPQLSDLHGASAIEKDADVVVFVHREEYYLDKMKPESIKGPEYEKWAESYQAAKGKAEIINGKRRRGRAGQTYVCLFDAERTTFKNMEHER